MTEDRHKSAEALERLLVANFQRVLDFLKFAEAKNAGLLTLSSAWTVAILNLLAGDKHLPRSFMTSLYIDLPFIICAALLSMVSFLPRVNLPHFLGGKRAGPHPKNLLYYGDISYLSAKQFEQDIYERYLPPETQGHRNEYMHDLIVQIAVNSQITMRKLLIFRWGMRSILMAGFFLLIAALVSVVPRIASLW